MLTRLRVFTTNVHPLLFEPTIQVLYYKNIMAGATVSHFFFPPFFLRNFPRQY